MIRVLPAVLVLVLVLACASAPPPVQAPAHVTQRPVHDADVRFMQDMLVHHAQALEMTALIPERTTNERIRLLARRIDRSQEDEMARMRSWLRVRGRAAPDGHAQHGAHAGMPGMASPDELERLRAASGAAFDRLFLELMIRHHEGALTMVAQLFETPGAGQDPELFQFANDIDADQRMEIARMRQMLQ